MPCSKWLEFRLSPDTRYIFEAAALRTRVGRSSPNLGRGGSMAAHKATLAHPAVFVIIVMG
jgi:hypothetical protein